MIIPSQVQREAYFNRTKLSDIVIENIFHGDSGFDTKHKINLSTARPNIEPCDIEREGVSLEQLEGLNVPVCRYKTQLTIHGAFSDATIGYCKANGYKSIVQNDNNSIGVRWVAIDGAKKRLVGKAVQLARGAGWSFCQNSQGTELQCIATIDKTGELREKAKLIPRDSFIGSVGISVAPLFGLAWLWVSVAAIPEQSLWRFIGHFTGIHSQAEYDAIEKAREEKAAIEEKEREAARAIEIEKRIAAKVELCGKLEEKYGLKRADPVAGKHYVRVCKTFDSEPAYYHVTLLKAFGRIVAKSERHQTVQDAIQAAKSGKAITGKGKELNASATLFIAA